MIFKSEFDIYDEVYIMKDNKPTKCSVRQINFPNVSTHCKTLDNDCILYGLLTIRDLQIYNGLLENQSDYIMRYQRTVGRTQEELFTKLLKLYKGR